MLTSTKISGLCPRCGARVELAPFATPHAQRCEACGSSFLAVLPELETTGEVGEAPGGELEVLLLPHGETRGLCAALDARGVLGLVRVVLGASGAALAVLLVLGVLALLLPNQRRILAWIAVPTLLVLALPLTVLLSSVVVRLILPRSAPARVSWRAPVAVAFGVTALAIGPFVWPQTLSWWPGPSSVAVALAMLMVGLPPGILVSRLVRTRPYRHGLAVVLTFTLGCLLLAIPLGWKAMAAALLFAAVQLPIVLLGARIGRGPKPSQDVT